MENEMIALDPASRAKMLKKIEALLAKAERTEFEAEAASYRAKAEELMAKYRIAEEEARERGDVNVATPIIEEIVVCNASSKFYQRYFNLISYTCGHAGCRMTYTWKVVDGIYSLVATLAGYETDVRYAQMLFMAAKLQFQANMEPERIADEPENLTAYRYRNAGKTRREVAVMLWGSTADRSVAAHQKVQKWYEEEAARQGTPVVAGRSVSRKDYVETYAESFTSRFAQRLRLARDASDSVGGQLVAVKRLGAVDEAFYTAFPNLRPKKDVEPHERYEDNRTAAQKRRDAAASDRDWEKRQARLTSVAGRAGWAAGTASADGVELTGVDPAKRINE